MTRRLRCATIAVLSMLCASHAHAWGNDGHRIVGFIATSMLNESARERLAHLLGSDDLASIATQLDENRDAWERRHPGASQWHYENRAVCGTEVSCPQGKCVTRQIERYLQVLRDTRAGRERQIEAVTVVTHLIADLHQPLHLSDNRDRGGNDVWVLMPREREPRRLHEVWDTRLVRLDMQRRSASNYSQTLLRRYPERTSEWAKGSIESWAAETYGVGRANAYRNLPGFSCSIAKQSSDSKKELTAEYIDQGRSIVAEQLTKAGVRLAAALNEALGRQNKPPF